MAGTLLKYASQFALLGLASSELMAIIKLRNDHERIVPKAEARISLLNELIQKSKSGTSPAVIRQELEDADKISAGANLTKSIEDLLNEIEMADINMAKAKTQMEKEATSKQPANVATPPTTSGKDTGNVTQDQERPPTKKPSSYM